MTLGDYIKNYRTIHKIGQRDFARMCGISAGYVSMLENNRNPKSGRPLSPRIELYQQVAAATGIGLDELINIVDDNITVGSRQEETAEQPAVPDWYNELSEEDKVLVQLIMNLPADKKRMLTDLAESWKPPVSEGTREAGQQ